MSNMLTILLLGVLGVLLGLLLAKLTKNRSSTPSHPAAQQDADMVRRLGQLKDQLDSGLITREEYQQEREILLRK